MPIDGLLLILPLVISGVAVCQALVVASWRRTTRVTTSGVVVAQPLVADSCLCIASVALGVTVVQALIACNWRKTASDIDGVAVCQVSVADS
jgi:hypothetical protein